VARLILHRTRIQESLANTKVSARQRCVYEGSCRRNLRHINPRLKGTFSGLHYNAVVNNTGLSSFVWLLLAHKSAKYCEIPREFEVIASQGYPRSSILVSIESAYATSY